MKQLLTIFFCYVLLLGFAQPPTRFYTKFGGNGVDVGYSAKQTLDRQYIIAGSTSSYGAGNTDVYLVKLDSMGQVIWAKTFGGFLNDVGKSVIQLPDSGYVIAGFTNSFGAGGYDALMLRTDKTGSLIWQRTFGGNDWDFANDLVYSPDGDIMVVGNTGSFGSGKKDGFVLKYDFLGNIVFQKYYGGVEDDELKSIIRTNDNFVATVGYTQSKGEINGDCYFLKLNLNGDTLFTKTFGGAYKDYANDLVQKVNGDYIICGAKTFTLNAKTSSYIHSITSTGTFLWNNDYLFDSSLNEEFLSVCNVNYLPTFTAYNRNIKIPGKNIQDLLFVAYSGGWVYIANDSGGDSDDYAYSVENTIDGGYIEVGTTESWNSINGDVYFIKRDSTVINYQSIVGVKENFLNKNAAKILHIMDSEVKIDIDNSNIRYLRILSAEGKTLYYSEIEKQNFIIDLKNYSKGLLIFSFLTKDGYGYNYKIIN